MTKEKIKRDKKIRAGKDLTNKRFGRLLCIKKSGFHNNYRMWLCKCDCGIKNKYKQQYFIDLCGMIADCQKTQQEDWSI
jgi:hypothetical protein